MANTGTVKVTIDDEKIKERMREYLAKAWDEGFKASEKGQWCTAHDQNDWCNYGENPYRQ